MATNYPDLFAALVAPFDSRDVKNRTGTGGKKFEYVTARTVMNRFDEILGPENWWDKYHPGENSVICELTIRLPDGSTLTKADAGGYAGMADSGDDDKSGFSDAYKRAAAKFGPGRYLYRDGVPSFGDIPQSAPEAHQPQRGNSEPPPREDRRPSPDGQTGGNQQASSGGKNWPSKPRSGKALFAVLRELEQRHDIELVSALNTWLKQSKIDSRLVDLDADQISKAWVWLCNFATKNGWTTAETVNGQSQQSGDSNGQGSTLKSMHARLWDLTKKWCVKALDGERNVTNVLVMAEINALLAHFSPGEVVERLGQLTDASVLGQMIESAQDRLATDSDIPF